MKVVGYADRLTAAPGDTIQFMVSADTATYTAELVRLIHGDTNPDGPGLKFEEVAADFAGAYSGKVQPIHVGSHAYARFKTPIDVSNGMTVLLWVYPTTPMYTPQTLITLRSNKNAWFRLRIIEGVLQVEIGSVPAQFATAVPLAGRRWSRVAVTYDHTAGAIALLTHSTRGHGRRHHVDGRVAVDVARSIDELMLAARPSSNGGTTEHYNGKIGAPSIYDRVLADAELDSLDNRLGLETPATAPAVAWDFSLNIDSDIVSDCSPHGRHGLTVQRPMRGATGHNWDGVETAWRHELPQYDAIHFHDDDLDNAEWTPEIVWRLPDDIASAVYAVRLRAGDAEDYIPFAVRPRRGTRTARIAVLLPTFTYLAYANDQVMGTANAREHLERLSYDVPAYPVAPQDKYIVVNRLLSLYDMHSDGTGVCYSSKLRPLANMRPAYDVPWMNEGRGSPHGLNADLHLVDWLYEMGYVVDVLTDEDLHHEALPLLEHYAVVLTGSHPEYWSRQMIDATRSYTENGGRLMYLGGNGMYWVTQLDEVSGHTIEIRRRGPATRVWEPAPGEAHLSVNGELGGIWRFRGRSPQSWLGVGFSAQGVGRGRPYERHAESFEPGVAWVFSGIDRAEKIGDFRALVNTYGAAGYELDRADPLLGTAECVVVLASATGFSDAYQAVTEEILEPDSAQSGSVNVNVRSDMTLLTHTSGGGVFSVGSIAWASCLSYNAYDNNVSRVTRNVLERFLDAEPINANSSD